MKLDSLFKTVSLINTIKADTMVAGILDTKTFRIGCTGCTGTQSLGDVEQEFKGTLGHYKTQARGKLHMKENTA